MTTLNFADLKAEADKKHGSPMKFVAANGKTVKLRRMESIPGNDLKTVLNLVDILGSKKVSEAQQIDAVSTLLVAVASDKKAMRESLAALPIDATVTILEAWMEDVQAGEATA